MDPSDDDDTTELSRELSLVDEMQHGMTALWRRLRAIKATLPGEDTAGNTGTDDPGD